MYAVTSLYAAVFAVMAMVLANVISAKRGKSNTAILHGSDMNLALWIRRHGNFIENVPLALILMGLAESRGLPAPWLHAMGSVLIAARFSHVAGLNTENAKHPLRLLGGIATQVAMLAAAVFLLWTR